MDYIIAIIQPSKLDAVQDALSALGVTGMTVSEIQGYGRQKGKAEIYRGAEYQVNFIPKTKLEIAVSNKQTKDVCVAIAKAASTGKIGDGKIFTLPLSDVMRIRTSETGEEAL